MEFLEFPHDELPEYTSFEPNLSIEHVPGELLGDGTASPTILPCENACDCARDSASVDPLVVVEPFILNGYECLWDILGESVEGDWRATLNTNFGQKPTVMAVKLTGLL